MTDANGEPRDLDEWLTPDLEVMRRKMRRTWTPLYPQGLLGPKERKSLQPMAAPWVCRGARPAQHFIASSAWDDGPLSTVLAGQADQLVGGADAALVIDDTAIPKQGAALGWGGAAIPRPERQYRQLSGAGLADLGQQRRASTGGAAPVPARGLDE